MVQGDKYSLPIEIKTKKNGTVITDEAVTKVRIKLGIVEDSYPDGGILFDSETRKWLLPLTQEQTLAMDNVRFQVRIVFPNGDIFNSVPQVLTIKEAIIREVENGESDNSGP